MCSPLSNPSQIILCLTIDQIVIFLLKSGYIKNISTKLFPLRLTTLPRNAKSQGIEWHRLNCNRRDFRKEESHVSLQVY